MAQDNRDDFRFRAKAILAVRHGRDLAEQLARLPAPPVGDLPAASLGAALRRLEAGDITEGRDLVVFEALQAGLAARMAAETTGSAIEPRHVGHDEDGDVWAWETVPTYTECGARAQAVHTRLARFLELRQDLLDHAAAERLVNRLKR